MTTVRQLFDALSRYAVEGPHYFDDDAYTDMPEKELVAEVIREKALLLYAGRDPAWHCRGGRAVQRAPGHRP